MLALAVGLLVGAAGRLGVHLAGLRRELRQLSRPGAANRAELQQLALLMAPLALGVAFSFVSERFDDFFSSQVGEGGVAARNYARRIVELPILLLPYGLSVVAFPHFASLAGRGRRDELFAFLGRTARGLAIAFAFVAAVTFVLAEPLVTLLLERGDFDAASRNLTAWPLQLYALGLVTFAVEAMVVPFYFALKDTVTPVVLGVAGVLVNVALTAALVGPLGVGGVALALTVSKSLKVAALAALLRRKREGFRLGPALGSLLRIALAAAAGGLAATAFTATWGHPGPGASPLIQVAYLAVASAFTAAVFLAGLFAWAPAERSLVMEGLRFVYSPPRPPR